jgi:hypothetical protein
MATRAKIGMVLEDYTVKSVYHHWDGYPEWLGRILKENYKTKEDVNALLEGGDISCIRSDVDWNGNDLPVQAPLYYKDRGDKDCGYVVEPATEFSKCERGEEYIYVFQNGHWNCHRAR